MVSETREWVCVVCGYVHWGESPPEECPVCGAPAEAFELRQDTSSSNNWQCMVCGYVFQGEAPPPECPVCSAPADAFDFVNPQRHDLPSQFKGVLVIVGGGIAGVAAAEAARQQSPSSTIILFSKENELPYYRLNLTRYLAGEISREQLLLYPETWFKQNNINLRLACEVKTILPDQHVVITQNGEQVHFDRLLLATGATPYLPSIPGVELKKVFVFRTLEDTEQVLTETQSRGRCVCLGGGVLGLEIAGGLAKRGVQVTVLESFDWLLPRQLNQKAARILENFVSSYGIYVKCGAKTLRIVGNQCVTGVELASGEFIPADFVVIAAGIRANVELAKKAGLAVQNGVLVNDRLQTSHPDIFAAGDVAEHQNVLYGLWDPARFQGTIAGKNMAGASIEFGGVPRSNVLKVLNIELFNIGVVSFPQDPSFVEIEEERATTYKRFVFQNNRLVGAILIGESKLITATTKAVKGKADFSSLLGQTPSVDAVVTHLQEAFK